MERLNWRPEPFSGSRVAFVLGFLLFLALPQASLAGCAGSSEPCNIEGATLAGSYHLALPEGEAPEDGWPAIVFLHGWGGEGAAVLRSQGRVLAATARGYAVIAPDGSPRDGRDGRSWHFHPGDRDGRDEAAFLRAVADDAAEQFGLDRGKMLLAGFSIGGSMTSYVACEAPESFDAYAPVAGSFWRPHPEDCAGPVRLHHTHGWSDGTVPLEGRSVGGGTLTQGDVFAAMSIWRKANRCPQENPDQATKQGDFLVRAWRECADQAALVFALHPGGHIVPDDWTGMVLDWYEAGDR